MSSDPKYEMILEALRDLSQDVRSLDHAVKHLARGVQMMAPPAPPCARCKISHEGQICPREWCHCPYCGQKGHIEAECQRSLDDLAADPVRDSPEYLPAPLPLSQAVGPPEYTPPSPPHSKRRRCGNQNSYRDLYTSRK
jgi:hypothetical protein